MSLFLAPSQVFVNRLIAFTGMSLHAGNWRSVLLTALLIAQKVWDDRCLVNGQFSLICPMFTVSKLNMLEKRFLEFLDYDVNISSRLYAKYYFELRALSEEQSNRAFALQPLNAKEARRLEVRFSYLRRVAMTYFFVGHVLSSLLIFYRTVVFLLEFFGVFSSDCHVFTFMLCVPFVSRRARVLAVSFDVGRRARERQGSRAERGRPAQVVRSVQQQAQGRRHLINSPPQRVLIYALFVCVCFHRLLAV
jgi:hypothetical protein